MSSSEFIKARKVRGYIKQCHELFLPFFHESKPPGLLTVTSKNGFAEIFDFAEQL